MSEYEALYERFLARRCSREEAELLLSYFRTDSGDIGLVRLIEARLEEWPDESALTDEDHAVIARNAERLEILITRKPRRLTRLLPYAAAAILLAATAAWWAVSHRQSALPTGQAGVSTEMADIAPGTNRATLTLADGRVIDLSEEQTGITVSDEDITYDDGVSSVVMLNGNDAPVSMLSLTTPKGGTYSITLPDGSQVWLNSASTLRYPNRFSDAERTVVIEGEGYFEIQQDAKRPFKVRSAGQEIEVLGTAFNISAYPDEAETKTTLVEGKVRVDGAVDVEPVPTRRGAHNHAPNKSSTILSPGQQATTRGAATTINTVDPEPYTAWKSGAISFEGKTFAQAMREVSRWYDIEIEYEGAVPAVELFGSINRGRNLSAVLTLLESSGIRYTLDGRKLTIMERSRR